MSKIVEVLFLIGLICGVTSCGNSFLDQMGRVLGDPSPREPRVTSFVTEHQIDVSWDPDRAADEYVLERAEDLMSPSFAVLYRGTATSWTDAHCCDQSRFLYRLSMTRGDRLFGPTVSVLGIGSAACRDELEPNDAESQATELEYDRAANLYYYRSFSGTEVEDADWYSVSVPPRRTATIVVTQEGLAGGMVTTCMYFYLKSTAPAAIINSAAIPIVNNSYKTKLFLFMISPNPQEFVSDPTLAGGSFITYSVSLVSIVDN